MSWAATSLLMKVTRVPGVTVIDFGVTPVVVIVIVVPPDGDGDGAGAGAGPGAGAGEGEPGAPPPHADNPSIAVNTAATIRVRLSFVTSIPPTGEARSSGSIQPVLGEVVAERALADAHDFSGVLLDTTCLIDRLADRLTLDPLDILVETRRWEAASLGGRRSDV